MAQISWFIWSLRIQAFLTKSCLLLVPRFLLGSISLTATVPYSRHSTVQMYVQQSVVVAVTARGTGCSYTLHSFQQQGKLSRSRRSMSTPYSVALRKNHGDTVEAPD